MIRRYIVVARGQISDDLVRRVSAVHATAILGRVFGVEDQAIAVESQPDIVGLEKHRGCTTRNVKV